MDPSLLPDACLDEQLSSKALSPETDCSAQAPQPADYQIEPLLPGSDDP
jgi:hypothetical protein